MPITVSRTVETRSIASDLADARELDLGAAAAATAR